MRRRGFKLRAAGSLLIILLEVWSMARKYAFNSPKYVFVHLYFTGFALPSNRIIHQNATIPIRSFLFPPLPEASFPPEKNWRRGCGKVVILATPLFPPAGVLSSKLSLTGGQEARSPVA
jgi:hypothetical protein